MPVPGYSFQGPRKMEHVTKREARQAGHSVCEAVTSLPYTARKPADQPKCDGSKSTINPRNTPARVLEPWNPGEVKVKSYPRTYGLDENGDPRTFAVQSHCRHCPVKGLYQPTKAAPQPAPRTRPAPQPAPRPAPGTAAHTAARNIIARVAPAPAPRPAPQPATRAPRPAPTGNGGGSSTAVPIRGGKRPAPTPAPGPTRKSARLTGR